MSCLFQGPFGADGYKLSNSGIAQPVSPIL
jgi:hypothetical protein